MEIGDGVTLEASNLEVRPVSGAVRRARSSFGGGVQGEIETGLAEAGFETASDVVLQPTARARRRDRGADRAELRVQVAADEGAVLLLEGEGGVLTWAQAERREPSARPATRRRGEAVAAEELVFTVAPPEGAPGARAARRGPLSWIGERLIDPVRVRVLRFVAVKGIDAALKHLEGDMKTGLVVLDRDPAGWTPGSALPEFPPGRTAKVLLLVHGTFSTTVGSFQALAATPEGQAFLSAAASRYDAVIGYDHRTLGEDPDQNARAILQALAGLPAGTEIDAVAYSRGGLVFRALAERFAAQRPDLVFRDAVFVGCTNGGTNLAEPDNWKAFADLYTNLAVAGARVVGLLTGAAINPALTFAIRTIGRFVQVVPEVAITQGRVPGLAAMEPGGAYVEALNGAEATLSGGRRYAVIASDFEPRIEPSKGLTGELVEFLVDGVVDQLLSEENDLVVHTASMARFGARDGLLDPGRRHLIDPSEVVYHTIYFASPTVARLLSQWLGLAGALATRPEASIPPPDTTEFILVGMHQQSDREEGEAPARADAETLESMFAGDAPLAPMADERPRRLRSRGRTRPPLARRDDGESASPPKPTPAQADYNFAASISPVLTLDQPAWLRVTISPDAVSVEAGRASARTSAAVDLGDKIRVDVVGLDNCRVAEDTPSSCEIAPPRQAQVLRFLVEGFRPGLARFQVEARQGARTLASFVLEPVFVAEAESQLTASRTATTGPADPDDPAVMRIYEIMGPNQTLTLRFDLSKVKPSIAAVHEIALQPGFNMAAFVAGFLGQLENAYQLEGAGYEAFLRRIKNFSVVHTNKLIPEKIREELWTHRDAIRAIQVISDSPHIPWELLCVVDPSGGVPKDGRFLCEWGLVRWLYNARWPVRELNLRPDRARYVIPEYLNPDDALEGAGQERDMLLAHFPAATAVPATSLGVEDFLADQAAQCDVLHFACHGEAKQDAVLSSDLLMEGLQRANGQIDDDPLGFPTVEANARFSGDGASGLVFVNACQTGRPGEGIAGVSGFASAFIRPNSQKGAAAFIGALWSVDDALALNFSAAFYDALLAGRTLVEAAAAGRAACQSKQDFTWLAYTVYGAPYARRATA